MNDPRITNVVDGSNFDPTPDADILDAALLPLTGDPGLTNSQLVVKRILNKLVVSAARPPAVSDLIEGFTQVFRDTENLNTYISIAGGSWEYQSTKDVCKQIFIGEFTEYTGGGTTTNVGVGEYYEFSQSLYVGVTPDSVLDRVLSEIVVSDAVFVGLKKLTTNQVTRTVIDTNKVVYFFGGTWENDFSTLTFAASEPIYYTQGSSFLFETIWSGVLYRTNIDDSYIQNLNAGKRFSDYDLLQFEFNANHITTIMTDSFGQNRDVNLTTDSSIIYIRNVSDTRFRTVGGTGSNTIRLNRIFGLKVR